MFLDQYGYNLFIEKQLKEDNLVPGRVIIITDDIYHVMTNTGIKKAMVDNLHPLIGDWVSINSQSNLINKIGHRSTELKLENLAYANVDTVFIFYSISDNFNFPEMEKIIMAVWESGATPIIILTKADSFVDSTKHLAEVKRNNPGVDVYLISNITKSGYEYIEKYFKPGRVIVVMGGENTGKKSFISNFDGKINHNNEMILLPNGSMVIYTGVKKTIINHKDNETFYDIDELATKCRFKDCKHESEPGCAVRKALEDGNLDIAHYNNFLKTKKESIKIVEIESEDSKIVRFDQKRQKDAVKFTKNNRNRDNWI